MSPEYYSDLTKEDLQNLLECESRKAKALQQDLTDCQNRVTAIKLALVQKL